MVGLEESGYCLLAYKIVQEGNVDGRIFTSNEGGEMSFYQVSATGQGGPKRPTASSAHTSNGPIKSMAMISMHRHMRGVFRRVRSIRRPELNCNTPVTVPGENHRKTLFDLSSELTWFLDL